MANAALSLAGQVSMAGSAVAALHKELSSPHAPRKVIKPVKSPSPSRRVAFVEARETAERPPTLFRDIRYERQFEGGAYAVSEEEFEDWEPQVGSSLPSSYVITFNSCVTCHLRSLQPITCHPAPFFLLFPSSHADPHPIVPFVGFHFP